MTLAELRFGLADTVVVLVYVLLVAYLGWLGFRRTKTAADYMVAGRKAHPYIMAMSYGSTFISTSAIVGFGGVAGLFGMSLLWLTFLNIFVGIFIAFVLLGGPTRRMGHHLDAHTFPELLGRRYQSKFIQVFAGLIIFVFMPLYAAAVMIGGCEFIATKFNFTGVMTTDYRIALLIFTILTGMYVVTGGLKGVMYTDALQGTIMFVGMAILLLFTYSKVGGVTAGHEDLSNLAPLVPASLQAKGHQGWTALPPFGFGALKFDYWWTIITTITLGVGIGVLAQPQLAVRFMTVKSKRELNRAVPVGGIFILAMTGIAFTVGALSNVYFAKQGKPFVGRVDKMVSAEAGQAILQVMEKTPEGVWQDKEQKAADGKITKVKVPVVLAKELMPEEVTLADGTGVQLVQGRSISIEYAKSNPDQIIPTYITSAMPRWFEMLFLLTLLAAAMSTMSSQFHTAGTAIGRDVFERLSGGQVGRGIGITRLGIIVGIFVAALISWHARGNMVIARATAIFFGLCASAFLPAFVGGLAFRGATRIGAISSMVTGFVVTAVWILLVKMPESGILGVAKALSGKPSLLDGKFNWPVVDPLVVALPISILVMIIVSLATRKNEQGHLDRCFARPNRLPTL